jgi:hypothetical protein
VSKKLIKIENNNYAQDIEQRHTINPKDLKNLELSVQNHTFHKPNKY